MATKSITTRIKNKVDSISTWASSTGKLLDGEIAIVRVPTGENYVNPVTGETEPVVALLMKVGDGEKTFNELPWLSAKASDVHNWAKKPEAEFVNWVKTLISIPETDLSNYYTKAQADEKFVTITTLSDYYTAAQVDEKFATITALSGYYTKEQADGKFATTADISGLQTQINTIVNNPDTEGVINSINEFTEYITNHGEIAEGFRTDIAAIDAKKIIDVAELPEGDFSTEATYRVLRGDFFMKDMQRGDSTCYIVDAIPEEGESVLVYTDYGFGFVGYYNRTDATLYGYFNDQTISDLRDYVDNSDLNAALKLVLNGIIGSLTTGWKTMEEVVSTLGTALSISWGGIVTSTEDMTEEDALYLCLSSEYYNYANGAWISAAKGGVGRVGQGMGGEIFNHPDNIATGTASHAEGQFTSASGDAAHAEGYQTIAQGATSHAEGDQAQATGAVAHAEGYKTKATGTYSHAEGCESQATGIAAHASGAHTKATGDYSFAAGRETTAAGENSVAMGWASTANGKGTVVLGTGLNGSDGAVVVGNFNAPAADAAFIVGSGIAGFVSNALVVNKDGSVLTKKGTLTTASELMSLQSAVDTKINSHRVTAGAKKDSVIGLAATAEGANTVASGIVAHAEGDGTQAIADYTHAEGYQTTATGVGAHAEGGTTTAEGIFSHTEGQNTVTTAEATWGHAEGVNTIVAGMAAHAEGNGTVAASYAQHVQGQFNVEDENTVYAHIVGNGPDEENRSNAHTIDWNGNGWFKGDVIVGGQDQYDEEAKTLIHTVATPENSGLKVTKEGGSVNIDFDSEVVFVFDCGGAPVA